MRRASLRCGDSRKRCGTNWKEVMFLFPAFIQEAFAHRSRGIRGWGQGRRRRSAKQISRDSNGWRARLRKRLRPKILRGVERRAPRILIGMDAYQIDFLQRLRPATYVSSLARKLAGQTRAREKWRRGNSPHYARPIGR